MNPPRRAAGEKQIDGPTAADRKTPRNLGGTSGVGEVSLRTVANGTYLSVIWRASDEPA